MRSPRKSRRGAGPREARGFTLLEVLIATGLAATLLLGLWSLFSLYADLFERGQAKTEQSQLARALLEQLTADLHSAIQDPIPGEPVEPRTSTPLRRFALSGSSHQLRLDVLQLTPLQGNLRPVSDSEQFLNQPSAARVPELRTVTYTFQEPLAASDAEVERLPGLVRREQDFETPAGAGPDSDPAGQSGEPGISPNGVWGATSPGEAGSPDALGPELVDASIVWVPEVVALEFRYSDGSGWTSDWNSLSRKSLPVAVEVAIQLGAAAESPEATGESEAVESTESSETLDEELAEEAQGPVYRLVIDIPGSPTHGAPRKVAAPTTRPRPRPATRRIAPRRSPATQPTARPLADEWMRTPS
jgi:type II secretory pathway pseudopilin PulG